MVGIAKRFGSQRLAALAAAGLLAVGGGVGAGAVYAARPVAVMGPVAISPIGSLARAGGPTADNVVTSVRGTVAQVFGSRFTLRDASGTALVETGPRDGEGLVAAGQTVTVQGRFDDGVIHAAFLVGADGKVIAVEPHGPRHGRPGGPDGGPGGPRSDHGCGPDGGPGGPGGPGRPGGPDRARDPGAPPPPPAPQPGTAAPAPAPTTR